MAYLSTVKVDPFSVTGDYLARWPQPFYSGEDAEDWYAEFGGVPRKIQREKLIHEDVYTCCVPVPQGTTSFDVLTGNQANPATAWVTPTLTGFGFQLQGQDGSISIAMLDGSDGATVTRIRRDGFYRRTIERWVHCKVVSGGSSPVGTPSLGVRAYLHYRSDCGGDVVQVEVEFSNASGTVAANGDGLGTDWYGDIYFSNCFWLMPAGWDRVDTRPLVTGGLHLFPQKLSTTRRMVLWRTAATNSPGTRAAELTRLLGLGRAYGGASYLTRKTYLANKTLMPDLGTGAFVGGYAGADARALGYFNRLNTCAANGTTDSVARILEPRMGLFHPYGAQDPQEPGGVEIATFMGLEQTRNYCRYALLAADMRMEHSILFCYNRATGKPLTTREFGDAYTTPGIPGYSTDPQYIGRQPFMYYIQNNSGSTYHTQETGQFKGWFPPRWPPHFLEERALLPNGQPNPIFHQFVPTVPPGVPAPFSMNVGTCTYESNAGGPSLVTRMIPNATFPAYFTGTRLGATEPQDGQHYCRISYHLKVGAWLADDLPCIDRIHMLAEYAAYAWSEVGHLPWTSYPPWNFRSLLTKNQSVLAAPHTAAAYYGREGGWISDIFATQYAISTPAERDAGYSGARSAGIRRRTEMMYETLFLTTMSNGISGRISFAESGNQGGLADMFILPPGVPYGMGESGLPQDESGMQIGLESPITMNSLFAFMKQLGATAGTDQILALASQHTSLSSLYTYYFSNVNEFGPKKFASVWDNDTQQPIAGEIAQRRYVGLGNPGSVNHVIMLELAWRLTGGNPFWFEVANDIGVPAAPGTTPAQRAATWLAEFNPNSPPTDQYRFNGSVIAFLLGQGTPDDNTPSFENSHLEFLKITGQGGAGFLLVGVDLLSHRMKIRDQDGSLIEIENVPDATPTNGGKFPITDQDGVPFYVPFFIQTIDTPINPTDPDQPGGGGGGDPEIDPGVPVAGGRLQVVTAGLKHAQVTAS